MYIKQLINSYLSDTKTEKIAYHVPAAVEHYNQHEKDMVKLLRTFNRYDAFGGSTMRAVTAILERE